MPETKHECIWLDEIESFPPYCLTHRCGEAARCLRDDCPHCAPVPANSSG